MVEDDILGTYRPIQQKNPPVSIYYRSRHILPALTVSFNLKWILNKHIVHFLMNSL